MKKDYMKPAGEIVAIRMNENISASGFGLTPGNRFGIHYGYGDEGQKFIFTSEVEASKTGNVKYDTFYDLINIRIFKIDPVCYVDTGSAK